MDNSKIYVGLDIGTTSIKVIVAEKVKDQINVLGVGNTPSMGVQRGIIVNIDKASEAISNAVSQAEEKASIQIQNVIVGIPADLLKIESCNGMIAISDQSREINDNDVIAVTRSAMIKNLPPEREIIDTIPDEFVVDGFDGIQDPRGMVGVRLEMHGHIITGPKTIIHNTEKAIEKAGLTPSSFTVSPLAESKVLLDDGEQDFGTTLIDIGGGQTTAAVIKGHHLQYTTVDNEGGQYITKDISIVLNTSINSAEKLKRDYGYADSIDVSDKNKFPVNVIGQNHPITVSEKMLSEIIQARLEQIFGRLKKKLDNISALDLPGGVVLTGGVAALPGISELAADVFDANVKIYIPDKMGLRHPSFSLPLSLDAYESRMTQINKLVRSALKENVNRKVRMNNNVNKHLSTEAKKHSNGVRSNLQHKSRPNRVTKHRKHSFMNKSAGLKQFFSDFFD